ncbi:carbohydrate ABC transporter permease [Nocardioides sp. LHG3406-4]|uniref:carbohydrate ABC transporter permease n=1 Tax=Nocardioides sp. LHG3406-4 TaxID=2804575 RepID=UPI003CE727B4
MGETTQLRWLRRVGLAGFAVLVGLPLLVVVTTSLKPLADVDDAFRWLPSRLTLRPYVDMWSTVPLGRYLLNSTVVAGATTLLALMVAVPASYALARSRVRGRRTFILLLVATQAAPGLLFLLPLFVLYAELGDRSGLELIGTYPGLVLTDLTFALPFSIWLLTTHLESLSREVEDAASVDGAGTLGVIRHVVLPTAAPGIAAVGVFAFVLAWSEVLFASILTQGQNQTLPVGLHAYASQSTVYWNQLAAAALATSLPVLLGVLLGRRLLARDEL